ncbi:hypothetical protein JEM67_22655 [Serratia sp. PAMC26656]|uniref:hypothetical protein n=1 Tax=Serratia sp. PAMC26656 TaxID=2775909 RepID=UPI0018F2E532|nr:hypothetical protein [Serratia sp. PAMC26656]MBJ7892839.1 hypothetical protein [Serratia sp. PAMC26656]
MDQVALVMAGLSNDVRCVDDAIDGNYTGWREAETYRMAIKQAITLKEIIPIRAFTYLPEEYNGGVDDLMLLENEKIGINTYIVDAEFLATDIWPWVENEMSSSSSWYSSKIKDNDTEKNIAPTHDIEWGEFAGRDTALMLIAGMAVALEKAGGKYLRGQSLNKSSVAQAAVSAINEYGRGTMITSKALTNLLNSALEVHTPKLDKE